VDLEYGTPQWTSAQRQTVPLQHPGKSRTDSRARSRKGPRKAARHVPRSSIADSPPNRSCCRRTHLMPVAAIDHLIHQLQAQPRLFQALMSTGEVIGTLPLIDVTERSRGTARPPVCRQAGGLQAAQVWPGSYRTRGREQDQRAVNGKVSLFSTMAVPNAGPSRPALSVTPTSRPGDEPAPPFVRVLAGCAQP